MPETETRETVEEVLTLLDAHDAVDEEWVARVVDALEAACFRPASETPEEQVTLSLDEREISVEMLTPEALLDAVEEAVDADAETTFTGVTA